MDRLVGLISSASKTRSSNDDDVVDRLSSRYTVVLLVVFALLVGMNQYVRNPITCWAPKHFTGAHSTYTTNYCWVRNTYYLPWNSPLPRRHDHRQMIPYYQWIPFILLGQAIFFYIPTIFWHGLNSRVRTNNDRFADIQCSLGHLPPPGHLLPPQKKTGNERRHLLSGPITHTPV